MWASTSRSSTNRTSLRREPIVLRNGSTPVTGCSSQASRPLAAESQWRRRRFGVWVWHDLPRLTRAAKQSCPSRPGPAPRAELAYRARSRGQPCHSVDCRCAQPSCRSNMHLSCWTRPAVLRSRRLAIAWMIPIVLARPGRLAAELATIRQVEARKLLQGRDRPGSRPWFLSHFGGNARCTRRLRHG